MSTPQTNFEQDEALARVLTTSQIDVREDEDLAMAFAASQVDHTPSTSTQRGLLKLSAELRNRIYYHAAIQHIRDVFLEGYNGHGLMYVSKQVRTEYFAIFHPLRRSLSAMYLKQPVPEEWIALDVYSILKHLQILNERSSRVPHIVLLSEDTGREDRIRE